MPGLIIEIGANVKPAVAGIQEVSLSLKEQRAILAQLKIEYAALSTQQARGSIGKALAADIAIANSEIKRLAAVSTSSFGAIGGAASKGFSAVRQLAYILPGIGIAGISSAAFAGLEALISGLTNSTSSINAFKEAIGGAGKEVAKAHANVSILREQISLAKDGFLNKNAVVKEYNDTIGKTTGLVNNIGEAEAALNKNAEAYIQFTLLKAAANIAFSKAGEAAFKIQDAIFNATRGNTSTEERIAAGVAGASAQEDARLAGKSGKEQAEAYNEAFNEALGAAKSPIATKLLEQFTEVGKELEQKAAELGKKFGFNFFDGNKAPKPLKVKDLVDIPSIRQLFQDFVLPDGTLDNFQKSFRLAMLGALKPLTLDEEISKDINDSITKAVGKIKGPLIIPVKLKINGQDQQEFVKELNSFIDSTQKIFEQGFANIGASIGEALGDAITGKSNAAKAVVNTIADLISQIGKAIIAYGIVQANLKKILAGFGITQPGLIIAIGIAAVAAAQVLRKAAQPRAAGGPVTAGQPYIVGERGQELFVPSTSGQIISNSNLQGVAGAARNSTSTEYIPIFKGTDLVLMVKRTERYLGRNV